MQMSEVEVRAANILAAGWPIGPRECPCHWCGEPWHVHPSEQCGGYEHDPADQLAWQAAEAAASSLLDDIAAYDDHLYQQRRVDRAPGPRVSDVGDCRRKVWYRETPPPDYTAVTVPRRQATMGSAFHDKAALARGWRYPWRHQNMPVQVPGLDGTFYVDEYDPVTATVVEDKTHGERKWEIVGDQGPDDAAIDQAMIYGLALDAAGWPVNRIQIICVRRDNGDEEPFWYLYDPARAAKALDGLLALADMIEAGMTPPRDGNGPGDWRCRFCPALAHCWQTEQAQQAGRSPESWTLLGQDPDAHIIEWAAEQVHTWQTAKATAKREYEQAKKLLDGVRTGRYGDYDVQIAQRGMPEYKATHFRNLAYLDLDDEHRPAYADFAKPEKRVDRWIKVTRVRAAKRQQPPEGPPVDEHLDTIA
jgi:hypothetical protein